MTSGVGRLTGCFRIMLQWTGFPLYSCRHSNAFHTQGQTDWPTREACCVQRPPMSNNSILIHILKWCRGSRRWKVLHIVQMKICLKSGICQVLQRSRQLMWCHSGLGWWLSAMPSLKSESGADPILPTNRGDALASLLEYEDCQYKQEFQRQTQVLKKQFCRGKSFAEKWIAFSRSRSLDVPHSDRK